VVDLPLLPEVRRARFRFSRCLRTTERSDTRGGGAGEVAFAAGCAGGAAAGVAAAAMSSECMHTGGHGLAGPAVPTAVNATTLVEMSLTVLRRAAAAVSVSVAVSPALNGFSNVTLRLRPKSESSRPGTVSKTRFTRLRTPDHEGEYHARATHSAQRTMHNAQRTAHSAQRTTHNAQRTAHNAQRTTHNAQRTAHSAQRTTHNAQRATCNAQRATHNVQHPTHNAQRATYWSQCIHLHTGGT
jgi:hypothetical protein